MKVYVIQKWMTRIIQNEMIIVILYRKKWHPKFGMDYFWNQTIPLNIPSMKYLL